MTYAGNIQAREAWELLKSDPAAQLVDVRTAAEWTFVGLPDLSSIGRSVILVEWQSFPAMSRNPQFESAVSEKLKAADVSSDTPIAFICRSGGRSQAAAAAMTAAGFAKCFNIVGGFEGDLNTAKHRGETSGWKSSRLPWVQT